MLLLREESLVKTTQFRNFVYVGDPANTVRIFNELEVDELLFLDIQASKKKRGPDLQMLRDIADECFMPLGYGGGIKGLDEAKAIFDIGIEKIAINTQAFENPLLIEQLAQQYGSQAVIVSIDYKYNIFGNPRVKIFGGTKNTDLHPIEWAREVEQRGAGEILLTAMNCEGTWSGFDQELIKKVTNQVSIPVIAHGGAGTVDHIQKVVKEADAAAVGLGSMVVFQKKGMGVLVNFPEKQELKDILL